MNVIMLLTLSKMERDELLRKSIVQQLMGRNTTPLVQVINKLFAASLERELESDREINRLRVILKDISDGKGVKNDSFSFIVEKLNQIHIIKPFKGIRFIFLDSMNEGFAAFNEGRSQLGKKIYHQPFAIESTQSFDVSLASVLEWLLTLNRVMVAELRIKLLPLGLLPNAVISEVNEQALELTDELALEEIGNEVVISKRILTEVLANWSSSVFAFENNRA